MNDTLKNDIEGRVRKIYSHFSDIMEEKNEIFTLEFTIKDSDIINGKSWCNDCIDHVEINSGVIDLYYDYFSEVVARKKIDFLRLLNIDECDDELEQMSCEGIMIRNGIPETFDSKIIDDEKAKLLEIFVSRFIIMHEFGHIFNGHCKFVTEEMNLSKLNGFSMYFNEEDLQFDERDSLDVRTLEMDADAFASTQSINHLFFLYENFDKQVNIQISKESLFYWWAFAIRSHFLVCEDKFMDTAYYRKMSHLPSVARWTLIYFSAIKILDLVCCKTLFDKGKIKSMLTQGAFDAERLFNQIKYSNYDWIKEIESSADYITYTDELNHNWNEIQKKLQKYARFPLFQE